MGAWGVLVLDIAALVCPCPPHPTLRVALALIVVIRHALAFSVTLLPWAPIVRRPGESLSLRRGSPNGPRTPTLVVGTTRPGGNNE